MIKNLPDRFPLSALDKFDFGDAEARDDNLLALCPVPTGSMNDFLIDKKDIVLGFRGTGKSAIVRLLMERKLRFRTDEGWEPILVCLDEEFDYRAIREHLYKHADSDRSRALACRVVWELLIIYRALQTIHNQESSCDSTIAEYLKEIDVLLGVATTKPRLLEIILSHKKKVGIKLDSNLPSVIDMYAGLEPSTSALSEPAEPSVLKLMEYKRYLNKFLHEHKKHLYVLLDRLDDFVVHEDYDTQRQLLQGLLATQTDYRQKYPNIKVKSFLRTDLFRKLDLSEFGPDKILARCVELRWSPSELKHLMAKRIAHNLMLALALSRLEISIDADQFLVSRDELPRLTESKISLTNFDPLSWAHWRRLLWLAYVRARSVANGDDGRIQNSMDVVNEAIITSIFPHDATHLKRDGTQTPIDLFDYFETHFQFAHGQATPRVMLSFMNQCLTYIREYYNSNRDIRDIKKNERGEFPLFVKKAIHSAYCALKNEAWEVQYQWAKKWESLVAVVQKLATQQTISYAQFVKEAKVENEVAKQFLAFVTHTGLLKCANERDRHEDRQYGLPLLFQRPKPKHDIQKL